LRRRRKEQEIFPHRPSPKHLKPVEIEIERRLIDMQEPEGPVAPVAPSVPSAPSRAAS